MLNKFKSQKGMTILEMVIAMFIASMLLLTLQVVLNSMSKTSKNLLDITDLQRKLRIASQVMQREIANAGGGISIVETFTTLSDSAKIGFSYLDLLQKHCSGTSEKAYVQFFVKDNSLMETISCQGVEKFNKPILITTDKINLSFKFLDDEGNNTLKSEEVTTIYYTIHIEAKNHLTSHNEKRFTRAQVNLVNHILD